MDRRTARELLSRLNRDAERIAVAFGLRYRAIEAERANVTRRYGVCYSDGTIRIRLRHARTGRPLKYSSLVSTLCHELAHLRHFHHGPSFRRYYAVILEWARREGIYRPAERAGLGAPSLVMAREAPRRSPPREAPKRARAGRGRGAGDPRQLTLFAAPAEGGEGS
jgi:hypothetical protein